MKVHTNTMTFYYAVRQQNKIVILKILQKISLEETYGEDGDTVVRLLVQTEDFAGKEVVEFLESLYYCDPNIAIKMREAVRLLTRNLECASNNSDDNLINSIARRVVEHEHEKFYGTLMLDKGFARYSHQQMAQMEDESMNFVDWLVDKGLNFDHQNEDGKAALHLSIEYNLQHISRAFLNRTPNVNRYIHQHNQSLLHTFLEKNAEYREKYREHYYTASQYTGYTSRHAAECAKLLLEKGDSALAYNCWDRTPLYIAIKENEDTGIIEMLIDDLLGKDRLATTTFVELLKGCAWWDDGRTEYFLNILRQLVDKGANVDVKDGYGTTPVYWAFSGKNRGAVAFLSDFGADFAVFTETGENLFHALAKKIHPSVVATDYTQNALFNLLLRKDCCDVNAKTKIDEETPLHFASGSGNLAIVRKLVEYGADVDCKNASGETPLHLAVHNQTEKVAELLLEYGADVNSKDFCGRWPLFHAVDSERDKNPLVPLLLEWGAYVNAEIAGETPFSRVVRRFCAFNAKAMIAYGADTNDDRVLSLLFSSDKRCGELQTLLMQHWVKLYAAKLPASKKHAAIIKSKIQQIFYNECLTEVEKMKNTLVNERVSIFSFIHMDFGRRRALINDEMVKAFVNSRELETQFPKYAAVILASYREAVLWKSLVESAKRGWLKLTGIRLPGECLEPIFAHLRNADLLGMIEYDEDL